MSDAVIHAVDRLIPLLIAVAGGGGIWKWLAARQRKAPITQMREAFDAERQSMERRLLDSERTHEQTQELIAELRSEVSELRGKVDHLEMENERAWRRVGVLEGVLSEHAIPIPD